MSKIDSLTSNYNKNQLAEKVIELSEKLAEMSQLEKKVVAEAGEMTDGLPAIGMIRKEDGTFQLVRLKYDLDKNAAIIVGIEDLDKDQHIAAGKLTKNAGELFYKAAGIK